MGCWCSICSSRLGPFFYLHVWVQGLVVLEYAPRLFELFEAVILWECANSQSSQLTLNDLQLAYQYTIHVHLKLLSRRMTFLEFLKLVIDYKSADTIIVHNRESQLIWAPYYSIQ